MKRLGSLLKLAAFLVVLMLALPTPVLAASPGMLVVGNTYTLSSGKTLEENLIILGGSVVIEQGGGVKGDILLLGGTLKVDGKVDGNISAAGGVLDLGETAQVNGDISTAGAALWQAEGAVVQGKIIRETRETLQNLRANNFHLPFVFDRVLSPLAFLTRSLVAAALAVLVMMFLPQPVQRVAQALASQPVLSGGMGILTILVFPLAFLMVVVTILLIPLGLFGLLVLGLAYLYGWIAFGYEVGRRILAIFHGDLAAPVVAGVGTLFISLLFGGLGQIPCLGWLISFLVWQAALGAVVLTRFGLQVYGQDLASGSLNPKA